jgi:phosphocarrier protein
VSKATNKYEIKNRLGLHARAATALVQMANRFRCEIKVRKGRLEVNAKSIMGVLQLAAARGQTVHITAQGADAEEAVAALGELIAGGFGETE